MRKLVREMKRYTDTKLKASDALSVAEEVRKAPEGSQEQLKKAYFEKVLKPNLPHLYRYKFFKWQREFMEAMRPNQRVRLISASNQSGKSMVASVNMIDIATRPDSWPKIWPILGRKDKMFGEVPSPFWFVHTDGTTAKSDIEKRWIPKYLPQLGPGRIPYDHPIYGWEYMWDKSRPDKIVFNSGAVIEFKTLEQSVLNLQGTSVFWVHTDEEMPSQLWAELWQRLSATQGYFSQNAAATRGEIFWRLAFEAQGEDHENFKGAWKRQISKYDCLEYEDGTPNPLITKKSIEEDRIGLSEREIKIRIYGKFAPASGLLVDSFTLKDNVVKKVSPDIGFNSGEDSNLYDSYLGIDLGMGRKKRSSVGIVGVLVNEARDFGFIDYCYRGDNTQMESGAIWEMIMKLRKERYLGLRLASCDPAGAGGDFILTGKNMGFPIVGARKARDEGFSLLNMLFRTKTLFLGVRGENDMGPIRLISEIDGVTFENVKKAGIRDDLIDSLRYTCMSIPWDWEAIKKRVGGDPKLPKKPEKKPLNTYGYDNGADRRRWKAHLDQNKIFNEGLDKEEELVFNSPWDHYE